MLTNFLTRVLPFTGHWFVVHISTDNRTHQTAVDAGDTAAVASFIHRGNNTKQNTYYGVCSFVAPPNEQLKRNRSCAVLGSFRTLRIDIDCGDGKDYQTFDDAVEAVDAFVDTTGLPTPLMVSSGRGLHVYFPFGRDLYHADWSNLSARLRAAAIKHGLKFDDNITEPERLLRLPTSINQRSGQECMVYDEGEDSTPEVLLSILSAYDAPPANNLLLGTPPAGMGGDELEANLLQPFSARLAIETCPAYAAIKATGGAGVQEPVWKGMLDVIVAGNDADEDKWALAQEISSGHESYTVDGLKQKLAQSYRQRYSPPTCSRVARPECANCPFSSRVKSPATLGVAGMIVPQLPASAVSAPPPVAPTPPTPVATSSGHEVVFDNVDIKFGRHGQFVVRNGLIHITVKEKDAYILKPLITEFRFHRAHFSRDRSGANPSLVAYFYLLDDRTGGKRDTIRVTIDNEIMASKDTFYRSLLKQSLTVPMKEIDNFKEFIVSFVTFLQQRGIERTKFKAIGWDGEDRFVFGDGTMTADGSVLPHEEPVGPTFSDDGDVMPVFAPSGDEALQVESLNQMLISPAAHLVVALSIATPLVRYTAFNGAMVSMYSKESGVGKTALLKAITSIWGEPQKSIIPSSSTAAATQHLIGQARSVPVAIDEVSGFSDLAIQELLYGVSQGQGKRRMGAGGETIHAQQAEWQTLLFVTTNVSIAEKARNVMPDSSAMLARLLEIRMPPLPIELTTGSPDIVLHRNYGFLGRKAAAAIMLHSADAWRETIAKGVQKWGPLLGTNAVHGEDRFRVALCALAEIGAVLGQYFGVKLDVDKVAEGVKGVCDSMRGDAEALVVTEEQILLRYIYDNSPRIGRLRVINGVQQTPTDDEVRDATFGELALAPRSGNSGYRIVGCRLPLHRLMAYAKEQKFNVTAFREWLTKGPHCRVIGQKVLMQGTKAALPVEAVQVSPNILSSLTLAGVDDAVDDEAATG